MPFQARDITIPPVPDWLQRGAGAITQYIPDIFAPGDPYLPGTMLLPEYMKDWAQGETVDPSEMMFESLTNQAGAGNPAIVMFGTRPWLREKIAQTIPDTRNRQGWLTKYSQDLPEETAPIKMLRDYLKSVGEKRPLHYGPEWESRIRIPRHELERKMPSEIGIKSEPAMGDLEPPVEPGDWRWYQPIEAITKPGQHLKGWEDIVRFGKETGPQMQFGIGAAGKNTIRDIDAALGRELIRGGPLYGGSGHLSFSAPFLSEAEQLDMIRRMMRAYGEWEPWAYPVREAHKPGLRGHVMPFTTRLTRGDPEQVKRLFENSAISRSDLAALPAAPGKWAGLNLQKLANYYPEAAKRVEVRAFRSPEHWPEWFENMNVIEALRQEGKKYEKLYPEEGFPAHLWENIIKPNREEIRAIREAQIMPPELREQMLRARPEESELDLIRKARERDPWLSNTENRLRLLEESYYEPRAAQASRGRTARVEEESWVPPDLAAHYVEEARNEMSGFEGSPIGREGLEAGSEMLAGSNALARLQSGLGEYEFDHMTREIANSLERARINQASRLQPRTWDDFQDAVRAASERYANRIASPLDADRIRSYFNSRESTWALADYIRREYPRDWFPGPKLRESVGRRGQTEPAWSRIHEGRSVPTEGYFRVFDAAQRRERGWHLRGHPTQDERIPGLSLYGLPGAPDWYDVRLVQTQAWDRMIESMQRELPQDLANDLPANLAASLRAGLEGVNPVENPEVVPEMLRAMLRTYGFDPGDEIMESTGFYRALRDYVLNHYYVRR